MSFPPNTLRRVHPITIQLFKRRQHIKNLLLQMTSSLFHFPAPTNRSPTQMTHYVTSIDWTASMPCTTSLDRPACARSSGLCTLKIQILRLRSLSQRGYAYACVTPFTSILRHPFRMKFSGISPPLIRFIERMAIQVRQGYAFSFAPSPLMHPSSMEGINLMSRQFLFGQDFAPVMHVVVVERHVHQLVLRTLLSHRSPLRMQGST